MGLFGAAQVRCAVGARGFNTVECIPRRLRRELGTIQLLLDLRNRKWRRSAGCRRRDDLEAQATDGAEIAPLAPRHFARTGFALFAEPFSVPMEDILDVCLTAKDGAVGEVAYAAAQHLVDRQRSSDFQYLSDSFRCEARFQCPRVAYSTVHPSRMSYTAM